MLRSCFLSNFFESRSAVSEKKLKMSQPIRGWGFHLVFPISPKTQTSQRPLPSLCFSGRSGKKRWLPWPLIDCDIFDFSDETAERKSTKFDRKQDDNVLYQVCVFGPIWKTRWSPWPLVGWDIFDFFSNSVQRFQRRSRKCLSQSEARAAILFFRSAQKHKLGRGHWDLLSCQISLNSVQRFQRRSRKCLSQSEARAAIFFSRPARKTKTL